MTPVENAHSINSRFFISLNMSSIHSIGHGNKPIELFLNELRSFNIKFLIDVRSRPYSKWNPQFNKHSLEKELEKHFKNKKITGTTRRGKYLFIDSDQDAVMVMHFGMTGDLQYVNKNEKVPDYTKLELQLSNDEKLAYISKRKLGFVKATTDAAKFISENKIGKDALDLNKKEFIEILKSKRSMLKSALMDQSALSGIGNVYADEILFQCRFHPKRSTSRLADDEWEVLYKKTQEILKTVIRHDAIPSDLPDSYLTPRRKEGEKCPKCKGNVEKIKISGRGGYYCPSCQEK